MEPIVTRVRMLEDGNFVAETKKTFRLFWLIPIKYWKSCFWEDCGWEDCWPKKYITVGLAKVDAKRYCIEQKEKYDTAQKAKAFKVQEQTCDEIFQEVQEQNCDEHQKEDIKG